MWGKNPKNVGWNDKVKFAVERKEVVWKEMFRPKNEVPKETCMDVFEKGLNVYIF